MTKKKVKNESYPNPNDDIANGMRSLIIEVVEEIIPEHIEENYVKLQKEEVKEIIKEILPDLDKIISDKIKEHFRELGEFLTKRGKDA